MLSYRNKDKENKVNEQPEYAPIVFVNKPAENYSQDVVGFKSQIEMIHQAIENGANMIGVIADYGTGKSTISEILISDVLNNEHRYSTIRINMWDSISKQTNSDISELTKSFLYQLANGNTNRQFESKLSRYISKRMSKNFNTISLSTASSKVCKFGIWSALSYTVYLIFSQIDTAYISNSEFLKLLKNINPIFLVFALVLLVYGILDTSIAFSSWKKTNDNHLESNDVFELYDEIATKLIDNSFENKQVVFIEDLDRIDDKELITDFLKELYRFQNSVSDNIKDKFVFIVSIKPEALLKTRNVKPEKENKDKTFEHLYSKVFDVTVNLKPIHFEDYESALLAMLDKNKESRERLIGLIGENIAEDHLPESFNWILRGENLTLRDLKDRLNHAISIMVSLKNKNYKGKPGISFTACTAVAYLESAFPVEFYGLVQEEEKFESFIRESYSIKNKLDDKKNELIKKYHKIFYGNIPDIIGYETPKDKFIDALCKLVLDNVFDDDFRMYFYTYPDNSYIKTVDEKDVCNLIKLPTIFDNVENLDEMVDRIFSSKPKTIVIDTIRNLNESEPYPMVLILNRTLFEYAVKFNSAKALQLLCQYTLKTNVGEEKILNCLKIINDAHIQETERNCFLQNYSDKILESFSNGELTNEKFMQLRKNIIIAFEKEIVVFIKLFVNEISSISIIDESEIELIDNTSDVLKLIDIRLVNTKMEYIFNRINAEKLSDEDCKLASSIYNELIVKDFENATLGINILHFLHINNLINIDFFNIVLTTVTNTESICEYINEFEVSTLPNEYLIGIDEKVIANGLSDELLQRMKNQNLYICYILSKAPKNEIDDIDYLNDTVREKIIYSSKILLNEDTSVFILLRKSIILKVQSVYDKYREIFEGEYPIITKEELNMFNNFSDAIICLDATKLNLENCDFVWEYCNQDNRSANECLSVFEYLFDKEYKLVVEDRDVAKKLIYALDFDKIRFCELNISQREVATNYVLELLGLSEPEEALKFLRHLKTLVPSLEQIIQESSLTEDYISLLNDLMTYTDTSIQWIESVKVKMGLCPVITNQLYNRKCYVNYVIGKSLYENKLVYDKNMLSIEQYFNMYLNRQCMYDVMSENEEFISDITKAGLYTQISSVALIKPLYYLPQTADMFEYIWSTLSDNEYSEYLMSIPKIATLDDSKNIQKFLCTQENMDKLGTHSMRDRIDFLLWDTHKTHKREFNTCWNKTWKSKLKTLENHLL